MAQKALTIVIKICTPSPEHRGWGDTFYAEGLKKAFERLGHRCRIDFKNQWYFNSEPADLTIHLRGLDRYRPQRTKGLNVVWLISHPELYTPQELKEYDLIFCASVKYAKLLHCQHSIDCIYLPQAADAEIFKPQQLADQQDIDILFAGTNYLYPQMRQVVADILPFVENKTFWLIGKKWKGTPAEKFLKAEFILPSEIVSLYRRTKIVLNDHHPEMQRWGFINDRTYALGRLGVFQICPYVEGLEHLGIVCYHDPCQIKQLVHFYLDNDIHRIWRSEIVQQRCMSFTFDHIAQSILRQIDVYASQKCLYSPMVAHTAIQQKNHKAIDLFQEAMAAFEAEDFPKAQHLIQLYRQQIDYSAFAVQDRRPADQTPPLFSVIIVTYNRPQEVLQCIEHLRRQLFTSYEIVLVDNGDVKSRFAAELADVAIDCPINFGLSEGRNIGTAFARGKILVFLDDDAIPAENYLPSIQEAFENYDIVGLRGKIVLPPEQDGQSAPIHYDLGASPYPKLCDTEGNSAFLRAIYQQVGGMDPLLFGHEGVDLSFRIGAHLQCLNRVIYWPKTVIVHPWSNEKVEEKKIRYTRNRRYLADKHSCDIFQINSSLKPSFLPAGKGVLFSIKKQPEVSIILSCHNEQRYLEECLISVLSQSMTRWELLAVDDGSTDNTFQILSRYAQKDSRIRIWRFDQTEGPYVRRNFAIQQARAPFVSIQDADDLMLPDKIKTLYEHIVADGRLMIVGSWYRRFLEIIPGEEYGDLMQLLVSHDELMHNFLNNWYLCWHGSAIFRKSFFDVIGFYDRQQWGSDFCWLAKAGLYGLLTGKARFYNIPHVLTFKRDHPLSQTGQIVYDDPRSRRRYHKAFFIQRLQQIMEAAKKDPTADIERMLRRCSAEDFVPTYQHLFQQWETQPVTQQMLEDLLQQITHDIQRDRFISAVIKMNVLEKMPIRLEEIYPAFYLHRAICFYAAGHDDNAQQDWVRCSDSLKRSNILDFSITSADKRRQAAKAILSEKHVAVPIQVLADTKQVSVIMPAFNAQQTIKSSIESVLRQTHRDFELIIIDDGSTDSTLAIIKSFVDPRIRWKAQQQQGVSAARNAGLKSAQGQFIVFLDSDDQMTDDFLRQHLAAFEKNSYADLIYCDDMLIDPTGATRQLLERPEYPDRRRLISELFRCGYPVIPFRTCIRRRVFEQVGLYDTSLLVSEDYDMLRRFLQHRFTPAHLKGAFYLRTVRPESLSQTRTQPKAKCFVEAIRRFGQTFKPDELFPDVDWSCWNDDKILYYNYLYQSQVFIQIALNYRKADKNNLIYDEACKVAREYLDFCLILKPGDLTAQRLIQQLEQELVKEQLTAC